MTNVKTKLAGAALVAAVALVAFFEGDYKTAYKDPVGIWTICYGHTGPEVKPGLRYTNEQCKALLAKDLQIANDTINACYPADLTPNERAALVSMAFNMGPGGMGRKDGMCTLKSGMTPTIRRLFNSGQHKAGCRQIPRWANPPLRGIIKRRAAEEALCLSD
jgi:lysozyme